MSRRQSWNIVTMFCVCIFGFSIATLLKPSDSFSETENRALAKFPKVTLETIFNGAFEEGYEAYLKDQFVLRDSWIGLKTDTERALLRQESKDIYFAEDDYLIEKHTGSFTSDQAKLNISYLSQFIDQYKDVFGLEHMTVMIVPNAVDILKDKLPAFAVPYDQETYLTQVQDAIPGVVYMNVSDVLKKHSDEEIYYRTDHHWTTLGAFYAYSAFAEQKGLGSIRLEDYERVAVTNSFEGTIQSKLGIETRPDTIERFDPVWNSTYQVIIGDEEPAATLYDPYALDTKNKYDYFFGGNHPVVKIVMGQNTGRKLLLIKDSYAHCFAPFLIDHYDEVTMVDLRYFTQKLSDLIAEGNYTDLLFLNNAAGFAEETSLIRLTY